MLGAAIGSFLNVLISRTVAGRDWVRSRSTCDHCGKPLAWYDLIPIFSYIAYRGRSRCCQKQLSWQHPIVEALMGSLLVWWYVVGMAFFQLVNSPLRSFQAGYWLLIGIVLVVIVISDWRYRLVPVVPVLLAIIISFLYRSAVFVWGPMNLVDYATYLLVALLAWAFFAILHYGTGGRGMGMGDVYIAPLYGLLLGWPRGMVALVLSFWIGAVVGIIAILIFGRTRKSTLPFAPFMVLGMVIALLYGQEIWSLWF
jgi:leader peptidase (prepilin peptidase) / N-methyltransferase